MVRSFTWTSTHTGSYLEWSKQVIEIRPSIYATLIESHSDSGFTEASKFFVMCFAWPSTYYRANAPDVCEQYRDVILVRRRVNKRLSVGFQFNAESQVYSIDPTAEHPIDRCMIHNAARFKVALTSWSYIHLLRDASNFIQHKSSCVFELVRFVVPDVFCWAHYLKIIQPVVVAIAVLVMDVFCVQKLSSKMLLHDDAMGQAALSIDSDLRISWRHADDSIRKRGLMPTPAAI